VRPSRIPELPPGTVEELRRLRGTPQLYGPLLALREAGWTLAALAAPLGVTREAVRNWLLAAEALDPPRQPAAAPPPSPAQRQAAAGRAAAAEARARRDTEARAAVDRYLPRLRQLQDDAAALRGPSASSPRLAAASAEYTALLNDAVTAGAPVALLADALGIRQATVYSRLRRAGYRKPAPSEHAPQWAARTPHQPHPAAGR
jgi:hypothetical protein